jgi:hypothetical protein
MSEFWTVLVTSSISILTVLLTSVGVTEAGRLRRELTSLTSMIGQVKPATPAYLALERLIDLGAARLLAIRLVRADPYWVSVAIFLFLSGTVSGAFAKDEFARQVGLIGFGVLAYAIGIWQFGRVWRLRRRQTRAILAGRPSGHYVLEAQYPWLRRSMRNRVLRANEYPLLPFLEWSLYGKS